MVYKVNDRVYFKYRTHIKYAWELNTNEEYVISSTAFATGNSLDFKIGKTYYEVTNKKGNSTSWFRYEDLMTVKEYRKEKLKKIMENYGN